MRMFITSKNKYLSNDMKIFGTCSIPLKLESYNFSTNFHWSVCINTFLEMSITIFHLYIVALVQLSLSLDRGQLLLKGVGVF